MPKKSDYSGGSKGSSKASASGYVPKSRVDWKGYVNVPLQETDKRHYHQWRQAPGVVDETMSTVLADGFKLSVDYQVRESAFRASLYCQNPDYPEAGFCLSIFASDWFKAVSQLLYIHAVKCQGSWEKFIKPASKVDDWDDYE